MRLPLAAGACGSPARAATLRVYAIDYALVRRTMRPHLAAGSCGSPGPGGDPAGLRHRLRSRASHDALAPHADACGYAGSGRRPCGSTPSTTLSCAARCARTSPPAPAARRVRAATLRVYAIDYALVRRTMRSHLTPTPAATPGPGGDPAGLRHRLRSRAPHDAPAPRRRLLRLAGSGRRPCGSAPSTTLSCVARCARTSRRRLRLRRVRAATLRVCAIDYALVRRTMRSHLAAGACGSPGRGATLRVYAIDYALVRRTMRSHLAAGACGS